MFRFPQVFPLQVERKDLQFAPLVTGDEDPAARHGNAGEANADAVNLPEQLRPVVGPLLQQTCVGGLAVVVRPLPGRPFQVGSRSQGNQGQQGTQRKHMRVS